MPEINVNGIYAAYMTGMEGSSFGIFMLNNGIIAGGDAAGGIYDGEYSISTDSFNIIGNIRTTTPPDTPTITGHAVSETPIEYNVPLNLPTDFSSKPFVRIETSAGALNVRFVLIRQL